MKKLNFWLVNLIITTFVALACADGEGDELEPIGSCTVNENCVKLFALSEDTKLDCSFLSGDNQDGSAISGEVTADTDRRCNGTQIGTCRLKGKLEENKDTVVLEQHYFGDGAFRQAGMRVCESKNGAWSQ